jgi:uncharacterized protein
MSSRIILLAFFLTAPFSVLASQEGSVSTMPIAQLQKLAESGDPAAQNELGLRFRLGTDVDKDPAKAVGWFRKAAKQGFSKAYFNLGVAYYNGDGVGVNDQDSCVWFLLASDAGDARGAEAFARAQQTFTPSQRNECESLAATAYLTGNLIKQDYGKAFQWYQRAAESKDGLACERLAYMYDRGLGVTANKEEALKWLKHSADLGYVPAIYEVGYMYDKGLGVPQDAARAKKQYELAAAGGQSEALVALGNMYEEGRGVKQDRQKALAFYLVAADFGNADGQAAVAKLKTQLSPKQISAAQDEAKRIKGLSKPPLALVRK